jgi:hypothetical protein
MRITGRSGGRFAAVPWCLWFAACAAYAAETPESQLEYLAQSLQTGDVKAALSVFDPGMPGYAEIRRDIESLAAFQHPSSAIRVEKVSNRGESEFRADTRWVLETFASQNGPLTIRTEPVTVGMHRVGNEWKIALLSSSAILAKPDDIAFRRIAELAGALSDGDGGEALALFDPDMRGYGEARGNIDALTSQTDVLCAIDAVQDRETGGVHVVDTDWYLQLKAKADTGISERRRQRVEITLQIKKGRLRIIGMAPLDILTPIRSN